MTKFLTASALTGLALAAFAMPASAITNESDCTNEGGVMVEVKGSDYCLVPIRDEAYADPIYDGNQLGVVDCPGDEVNDGIYCMYPVTIRPEEKAEDDAATLMEDASKSVPAEPEKDMTEAVADKATEMAKDEATDEAKKMSDKAAKKAAKKAARAAKKAAREAEKAAKQAK
ncbi:MAG: hypothetical protein ACPGVT_03230 [Maricaulaceae bacterium]